ncbi:hypothetical protein [Ilumatobacter coccineus]|uniref:hypothetical protein n=1 Tax=Ilumatobacter coccineus TaxID=467094 RepID=UPI0012B6A382|nr:hypothetical protein [Ilumatobacter coccineus]
MATFVDRTGCVDLERSDPSRQLAHLALMVAGADVRQGGQVGLVQPVDHRVPQREQLERVGRERHLGQRRFGTPRLLEVEHFGHCHAS